MTERSGLTRSTWRDPYALNIGILAPPWLPVPPSAHGSTETVIDTLARGLEAAGHHVVLFTTGDATCPVRREWCFAKSLGGRSSATGAEARQVIEGYDALRAVDIIHDHTLFGPLYGRVSDGPPSVTTNHGPFDEDLTPVYRAVAERVPIIAVSHHQARSANGIPIARVIHHGLETDTIPLGDGQGGYALFLGSMHPDKGVDTALSVARAAGIPLRIAAHIDDPLGREYFETQIKPRLGRHAEYLGEVSAAEKFDLLGSAQCLLNPVRWPDPFDVVMLEALACGTPVVTTPYGSAAEIVEDGVTGFIARDSENLVRAVSRVPTIERTRCRAAAQTRFPAARMVANHVALYRHVLSSAASQQRTVSHHG